MGMGGRAIHAKVGSRDGNSREREGKVPHRGLSGRKEVTHRT